MTIGTYYLVGVSSFFFTLIPFYFFLTGILPAHMSFTEFLIHGSSVAFIAILIYLYVQQWMAHPVTERGLHWRGMILKYSSWPVFFLGFLLAVVNAEIPYIPTAKNAVTGYFTPFARPLVVHVLLFFAAFIAVFIQRMYYLPESELILSAEKTWGMMGFAFIACILSIGGILAAWEAQYLKIEDPWKKINLNPINH